MNAINWFEIPVSDFARAVAFYEQILATKLPPDTSFPDMQMAILPYSEPGVGGCLIQYAPLKPHADGARIYLNGGDDLQAILDRVTGWRDLEPQLNTKVERLIDFVTQDHLDAG